jgi:hypothetical protein
MLLRNGPWTDIVQELLPGVALDQLTALLQPGQAVFLLVPAVKSQLLALQTIRALLYNLVSLMDHFYGNPVISY